MKDFPLNIAIVILAAGASRRMGEPKQLLPLGKTTLIEHTVKNALEVKINTCAVVLGANYEAIHSHLKDYPIKIINNNLWQNGIGSSISKAASYFMSDNPKIEALMFILADQPFVTSAHLRKMIESFIPNNKQILATRYKDKKVGVPVLFDSFYLNELASLNGDIGAHSVLKKYKTFVDALEAPFVNMDIDSKEDYHKAKTKMFKN